jgi:hypothetical protein
MMCMCKWRLKRSELVARAKSSEFSDDKKTVLSFRLALPQIVYTICSGPFELGTRNNGRDAGVKTAAAAASMHTTKTPKARECPWGTRETTEVIRGRSREL